MRWPRWLVRLIPRLGPAPRWEDAVLETAPEALARCAAIYADVLARVQRVRPDAVRYPEWSGRLYVLDAAWLPDPYRGHWAVGFPQHDDGGNAGGSIVVLRAHRTHAQLLAHECAHLITGITEHPAWLFAPDGISLTIERPT